MTLQWLPFKIDLKSLEDYLRDSFPDNFDGIIATEENFKIIFTTEDQTTQNIVNTYLQSLDEQTEALSLARPSLLYNSIIKYRQYLLEKEIVDYTTLDKKILMNIKLTEDEELWIINYIEAQND